MAPSKKSGHRAKEALTDYDTRLKKIEDRLADQAKKTEALFRERTSGFESRLEAVEDKLEKRAKKADGALS